MPPEPNPDGSYTFSQEEIANLRSYLSVLKNPDMDQKLRLEYIQEAEAYLPTERQQLEHADKFEGLVQKQILEHEARYSPPTPPQKPQPPSPELVAIEKALKERHEKESQLLARSHKADLNHIGTPENYFVVIERQEKERQRLQATQATEVKRYTQEHHEAQKLLKQMDDRTRKEELTLKPDEPRRSL